MQGIRKALAEDRLDEFAKEFYQNRSRETLKNWLETDKNPNLHRTACGRIFKAAKF